MQIIEVDPSTLVARENPRTTMDDEKYKEARASVEANGILEPIRVFRDGEDLVIESGHRRARAATELGLPQVPVMVVEDDTITRKVAAVVTNVIREDMNPVDEAQAYMALLGEGLSPDGIAEKVGVGLRRVKERLDLLELPEAIVELFRSGGLTPSCRRPLREVAKVSPDLALWMAEQCAGKPDWLGVLSTEHERVLVYAAQERKYTYAVPGRVEYGGLKLSKKIKDRIAAYEQANKYTWVPRLDGSDVDAARAAGVLIEAGEGRGVITDVEWMREQVIVVLERDEKELVERQKRAATAKARELVQSGGVEPTDESAEATALREQVKEFRSEHRRALLQGKVAARAANLELGRALMNGLAMVDVGALTVDQAKLIAYGLCGPGRSELFLSGLRYVLEEFQREEVVLRKDKSEKRTIHYIEKHMDASKAFDAWLGRAKKPGEIVGRALIALAAAQFADQGCVPQSARKGGGIPRSAGTYANSVSDGKSAASEFPGWPVEATLKKAVAAVIPKELKGSVKPSEKAVRALVKRTDSTTLRAAGFTIAAGGA